MTTPTTATLEYSVVKTNPAISDTALKDALNGVTLYSSPTTDPVLNGLYGCTVASDTPGGGSGTETRTIVLNLGSRFFVQFPTASAWNGCFPNLYRQTLSQAVASRVAAANVVFA